MTFRSVLHEICRAPSISHRTRLLVKHCQAIHEQLIHLPFPFCVVSGGFFTGTRDTEEVILSGCAREDPSRLGSLEAAASDSDPSSSSPSFFWLLRSSSIWEAGGCYNQLPGDTQFYRPPSASWVFFSIIISRTFCFSMLAQWYKTGASFTIFWK